MPNIVKGSDMRGLLRYLAGPGRVGESRHTDQRVVAGDPVVMAVYAGPIDLARAVELAALLDSPRQTLLQGAPVLATNYKAARKMIAEGMDRKAAFEATTKDTNVWHCSLALKAEEGDLADPKWEAIANDFMREMGFIGRADGVPDVRWAAINHGRAGADGNGGDHIHIAMSVVRPDGSLADVFQDHPRAQAASNMLEHKYGLQVLHSREEASTERATKPGERARAQRLGAPETDREALSRRVRALAVASGSEAEWIREVQAAGIIISPYFRRGGMDEVTGYKVELPPRRNLDGKLEKSLSYGGGYLARDLTLPRIREWAPWDRGADAREEALTEWRNITKSSGKQHHSRISSPLDEQQTVDELGRWSRYVREIPAADRDAWAKAASQSSGMFAALSVRTEQRPGPLDRLSRQLARAGHVQGEQRRPWGVHGSGLRHVSRMLMSLSPDPARANLALMYAMVDCLLAVRDMLAATERANTAATMAAEARKALTVIHLRAAGVDPSTERDKGVGSPVWAAQERARGFVDGVDPTETEKRIEGSRGAYIARSGFGSPRTAAQSPLTPPPGSGRTQGRPPGQTPGRPPNTLRPPGHDRPRGFEH
ncbi:hypothetical protein AB0M22_45090 [Nocardia sp. NPDC051756]|uniref:relaxase/mobilization nuclease domain-containing protein n=1 Tax=Nocardia sp. NPDC051756 TaxID=3154751 RepID=UPI00342F7A3E